MSYKSASLSVFHAHSQKGAECLVVDSPRWASDAVRAGDDRIASIFPFPKEIQSYLCFWS